MKRKNVIPPPQSKRRKSGAFLRKLSSLEKDLRQGDSKTAL